MTFTKTAFASLLAALVALSLAPAAFAQGLPDPADVTATTDDLTGGAIGTVGDTTDGVTGTVGSTTDEVTDTVDNATGTVGGTADEVTDTVDTTTGGATGGATDAVDHTTDSVGSATGEITDTIDDTTNGGSGGLADPVTDAVDNVTGGGSGSTPQNGRTGTIVDNFLGTTSGTAPALSELTPALLDDLVEEAAASGLTPAAAEGWIDGKKVLGGTAYESPAAVLAALGSLLEDFAGDLVAGRSTGSGELTLSNPDVRDSFFDSAGRAAVAAAKALAFPLALALLVVGFLAVQGRIGRKDPKLTLAPVDVDQQSLTFE